MARRNQRSTKTNRGKRCMRPGPLMRNPYLNFLREYRKRCCGLSAVETVVQGAQVWKSLPKDEKARYILEAFYAPKRLRRQHMTKPVRSRVNRHRLASSRMSRGRKRVRSHR